MIYHLASFRYGRLPNVLSILAPEQVELSELFDDGSQPASGPNEIVKPQASWQFSLRPSFSSPSVG